jgi:hypothetical protein
MVLVQAQRSGEEPHVRRNDVTGSQAYDVAGDELARNNLPA